MHACLIRQEPPAKLRHVSEQGNFHLGLKEAAMRLGVCATTLKRRCRKLGIERWPHRTIKKYEKALQQVRKMEAASGIQRTPSFGAAHFCIRNFAATWR